MNCSFLSQQRVRQLIISELTQLIHFQVLVGHLSLLARTGDDLALHGKLGRAETQRFARDFIDTPSISNMIRPGLTLQAQNSTEPGLAHADFGRLLRDGNIREDPDPDTASAFHVTRDRTTVASI